MGNTGATTPARAAEQWGAVANAWDATIDQVDLQHAAATDRLVASLGLRPGDRLLELGAGPGSLGPRWAELVGPNGVVVLSDIAPAMVAVARRRNQGLTNLEVGVLDAASIDRPDHSFDAVVSRMGLMFVDDPTAALAEARRVLAPGGRLGAMTWAAPPDNPWITCVGMAAAVHGIVDGPPVGPGTIFSLSDPGVLAAAARDAGFHDVVVDEADVAFHAADAPAHVERVGALAGGLAERLAHATPEQRAAVVATATELVAPYATDDALELPGRVLLLTAHA